MRINLIITWDKAPATGRFSVTDGKLANALINVGWGDYDQSTHRFTFNSVDESCRISFAVDSDAADVQSLKTVFRLTDTALPLSVAIRDVLRQPGGKFRLNEAHAEITAEVDDWESAGGGVNPKSAAIEEREIKGLPLYKGFTEAQLKQFGGIRKREVLKTEKRAYSSPFMYENLKVGNFYEIDPTKGVEFKSMDGFITLEEDKPIVGVTVVGSGCVPYGFNICEWWDEGESIDNMKNQLVKRQRIDNLHGTHPSIYSQILMGTFPGLTLSAVTEGQMTSAAQCLKQLSDGYYGGYFMGFYENVANFRPGPPYPRKITIRAGTKLTEDTGTSLERHPGDYAVRVIETTVMI